MRALLAGALVLGVGGTLTLAAWTDTEYAAGTFATSTFGIVGSVDGVAYADHPTEGPAVLVFANTPGAMSPGTTVFSRFLVKTTNSTNVAGTVTLTGPASVAGLAAALTYGVKVIPAANACTQATYDASTTVVVPSTSALTVGASGSQALVAGGASPVAYCFAVTLPAGAPNSLQGQTATVPWKFTATSAS